MKMMYLIGKIRDEFTLFFTDTRRLIIILLLIFWYACSWREIVRFPYLPIKNNLMIGQNVIGSLSMTIDPEIPLNSPVGYDSQYFWALSLDPSLRDSTVIAGMGASAAYRSQRILLPFLTWCIIRDPSHILFGLWFWSFVGIILGAIGVIRLCKYFNIYSIGPIAFFIFSPGMVIASVHPMSDALASGLVLLAWSYWVRRQTWICAFIFALACLTREFSVFMIGILVSYTVLIDKLNVLARVLPLLISIIPAILWQYYIYLQLGSSGSIITNNYSFPFVGTIDSWNSYIHHRVDLEDFLAAVFIHLSCFAALILWYKSWKQELIYVLIASAAFISICGQSIMEDNFGSSRIAILYSIILSMALFSKNENHFKKEPVKT